MVEPIAAQDKRGDDAPRSSTLTPGQRLPYRPGMDRRRFLVSVVGAVAWPLAAEAQPGGKMYRVAFLGSTSPSEYASQMEAFRTELRGLGYVEGKNVVIEFRWAQARNDRLPELAEELVRLKPDVLVTHGAPGALAAKRATSTIPIVVGVVAEAVAIGAVDGLARPGGNITGSSFFVPELSAKRLQFLKEAVPNLGRVGLLLKRDNPVNPPVLRAMEQAAQSLKIQLESVEVTRPADIENAVSALVKGHAGAIAVIDEAMLLAQSERIANMARKHSLPTIGFVEYARAGGLLGFGVNFADLWRRAAVFVDKILRGRQAGRPPRRAAHQVRAGHQPQDREGARPHDPAVAAGAGGSGDRSMRTVVGSRHTTTVEPAVTVHQPSIRARTAHDVVFDRRRSWDRRGWASHSVSRSRKTINHPENARTGTLCLEDDGSVAAIAPSATPECARLEATGRARPRRRNSS